MVILMTMITTITMMMRRPMTMASGPVTMSF